jgi:glycine oxidase
MAMTKALRHEPIRIIGAGVAGLCLANELMWRGQPVALHDYQDTPGPHACSWWAGGMLAPFCEGETAEEPVVRFGGEAAGWWQQNGVEISKQGTLVLALGRDQKELNRFARRTLQHQPADAAMIAQLEPALANHHRRGLFFETEAHLTPRDALTKLRDNLAQQGVNIIRVQPADTATNDDQQRQRQQQPAGMTIDCRGLAAADQLRDLRGVKGEMLVLRCPDITLNRPIRLLHPRFPIYIVPRGDGLFMLGATQIESADRDRVTARSVMELLSAAYALHPTFGEAEIVEIGVDARPAFADNLPRIRRRGQTVFVNGLFRHGFLLAPAVARMTADYVLQNQRPEIMDEDHH